MRAQDFIDRIDIEQKVEEQDSETGDVSHSWVALYERVPAKVLTGAGREFQAAGSKQAEADCRIWFRVLPGITSDLRVIWGTQVMDIISVELDSLNRYVHMLRCKAGVNNGG